MKTATVRRTTLVLAAAALAATIVMEDSAAGPARNQDRKAIAAAMERANLPALRLAIEDLAETYRRRYRKGAEYLSRLERLEARAAAPVADVEAARRLEREIEALRTEALLANPLLDFEKILLVERSADMPEPGLPGHMDKYKHRRRAQSFLSPRYGLPENWTGIGKKYVHFGTAWSTDHGRKQGTYNLYYCTSDKVTGPYGPRRFAGRFLGHGTPFQDKAGKWWCTAFFNANVLPIVHSEALKPSVGDNAHTINEQGVTIVPLDVRVLENGDVRIRAKDPAYADPGPEEVQHFRD